MPTPPITAPLKIHLHQKSQELELVFASEQFLLPAEYLRVFSPSAEVQGHGASQQVLQHGKINVGIKSIISQGNYAIKIVFDDGHDSGIYTWNYLYELGKFQVQNWRDYEQRLGHAGKSRDPNESPVRFIS
ncbi:MAG TPA: DUF971 domain-containing protein [Cellvibrionaceae bacterium]